MSTPRATTLRTHSPFITASEELPSVLNLTHESELLHLLFHRNKNQHRSSRWWKYLCILRSNVRKLVSELSLLEELQHGKSPGNLAGSMTATSSRMGGGGNNMTKTQLKKIRKLEKEKFKDRGGDVVTNGVETIVKARQRVDARLTAMKRNVIPRTWVAFTTVVATTQFSALGMVLLGVLGRVSQLIGRVDGDDQVERGIKEEKGMKGAQERLGVYAEGMWGDGRSGWVQDRERDDTEEFDDGGVVISRRLESTEEMFDDDGEGSEDGVVGMEVEVGPGNLAEKTCHIGDDTPNPDNELAAMTSISGDTPLARNEFRGEPGNMESTERLQREPSTSAKTPSTLTIIPDLDFFSSSPATHRDTESMLASSTISQTAKRKAKPPSSTTADGDKPRRKKKKGNAIDDLFKGLV